MAHQINQLVAAALGEEDVAPTLRRCGVVFEHNEEQFTTVEPALESAESKYLRVVGMEHKRMLGQMKELKSDFTVDPEAYRTSEKVGRLRSM